MRKKANPKLIGAFVMGALVLFVLALVVLGGGRLFQSTRMAVAYFDRSVAGLNEGAPVTFRGVRVGQVKSLALRVDTVELKARIPVYLEFQLDRIEWADKEGFDEDQLQQLIDRGLRAKLVAQSFVTGQLMVELNFEPETPVTLHGDGDVPEIPTTESELEQLKTALSSLPLQDMMGAATQAISRLNEILGKDGMEKLGPMAITTLEEYRGLAKELRSALGPGARAATDSFRQAERSLQRIDQQMVATLETVRETTDTLKAELVPLAKQLRTTSGAATSAIQQAEKTMQNANQTLEPGSATQRDLRRALKEFADAARAVRALAEKLERNPNALITGKQR